MSAPRSDLVDRNKTRIEYSPRTIVLWGTTIVVALIFIVAALPKLGGFGFFEDAFERWGYPGWLEMGVGIIEFIGAVFLIIPTTAFFAAILLGAVMVGAIITHLFLGNPLNVFVPLLVLAALVFVGWARRPQAAQTRQPRVG